MSAKPIAFAILFSLVLSSACTSELGGETSSSQTEESSSALSNSYVTTYSTWQHAQSGFPTVETQITVHDKPSSGANYFYAHNGQLEGGDSFYMGLQTNGMAIFSVWNAVNATDAGGGTWCQEFGGEGVGYSCRLQYDWVEGRTYTFRFSQLSDGSFGGFVTDVSTGEETMLGSIMPRQGAGLPKARIVDFVEYFGGDFPSCSDLEFTTVTFNVPRGNESFAARSTGSSIGNGACEAVRDVSVDNRGAHHRMGTRANLTPVAASDCGWLLPGQELAPGNSIVSCDGRFIFVHQTDGNVVLYADGEALWHTYTWGKSTSALVMQTDGNLVLYDTSGEALWHSVTYGNPGARMVVQDDGNLVIYNSGYSPLWSSRTGGR